MTHTGELHDNIAEHTSKARRSTTEVKVPIYFSITAVRLWFIPKGLTKQRSNTMITPGTSGRWYLSDPRKDWEGVIGVRPPTALRKHQPERGGIQRPGRSCHLQGYHNYPCGWAQPQVTDSIDTTSTLSIATLATYDNQSIRSNGDPVPKYKHYT